MEKLEDHYLAVMRYEKFLKDIGKALSATEVRKRLSMYNSPFARRAYNFAKLSKAIAGRITKFIDKRIAVPTEPKASGKKLEGDSTTASIAGYYRILGTVERQTVHILIVATGHRRKIQKQ